VSYFNAVVVVVLVLVVGRLLLMLELLTIVDGSRSRSILKWMENILNGGMGVYYFNEYAGKCNIKDTAD